MDPCGPIGKKILNHHIYSCDENGKETNLDYGFEGFCIELAEKHDVCHASFCW